MGLQRIQNKAVQLQPLHTPPRSHRPPVPKRRLMHERGRAVNRACRLRGYGSTRRG